MNSKHIPSVIFCLYALLLGITIWNHEMWRDELQPWGIVTHSNSFSDLIANKTYEGHPILWFAILWVVSKISVEPASMQLINYLLSLIAAWLIIFKSPFSTFQKVLIVFGYYFLFEYAAISRDYMLAMVMILGICFLWKSPAKNAVWLIILFFLLCFTEMYASIISLCLAATLFLQEFFRPSLSEKKWKSLQFPFAASTGFFLSYITTVPPDDSELNYPVRLVFNSDHLIRVLGNFWNGFIPVPKIQQHFWSSPLWQDTKLAAVLGTILLIVILSQAFRYKQLFIFLVVSFSGMFLFMYFKYSGFQRHFGHLFIIYLCYEWIKRYEPEIPAAPKFQKISTWLVFHIILLINAVVGISFAVADWKLPFSTGKQTAQYIEAHFPNDVNVAGYTDCPATTVANYLRKDIYLLNNLRKSSYIIFTTRRPQPEQDEILNNILMLTDSLKLLAVVLNYPLEVTNEHLLDLIDEETTIAYHSKSGDEQIHFKTVAYFGNSMAGGENFYVYEVRKLSE